ncbi:MAG: archaeosortase/exosortase family protein [Chloroflexi bacterium]|nr:archaeosortase/exosortase family protein [Chloroflexota bacterium]
MSLALAAYFALFQSPVMDAIARWTAVATAKVLTALGTQVSITGTIVGTPTFAYTIVTECTAIGPILLFMAAVVAYPTTLRAKVLGILLGVVSLSAINMVRLVSLFYIGAAFPQQLPLAHYVIWQSAIIISALLLWLFWADRYGHAARA